MRTTLIRHTQFALAFLVASTQMAAAEISCNKQPCKNLMVSKELSEKFDSATPLFLDKHHSTDLLNAAPKLAENSQMHGLLNLVSRPTQDMQASNHVTCAVVGNSQNLRRSNYGLIIDAHDYVFRMNSAPVKGYEEDVGAKTTHHIYNYGTNYQIDGNKGVRMYSPDTINIIIPLPVQHPSQAYHQINQYADYEPFFLKLAADYKMRSVPNLVISHPAFVWYVNTKWFTPKNKNNGDAASKGLFTTVLAIHMCDKVDLFGFGADQNGKWSHYFGDGQVPVMHRPGYQEDLFDALEKAHVITQYRGRSNFQ